MNVKNKKNLYFLYCKHFDIKFMNGDITNCPLASRGCPKNWRCLVHCCPVRGSPGTLLDSGITVNDTHIKLYSEYPYVRQRGVDTERVVVKDYPMWEDDCHIINYFKSLASLELHSDDIFVSKARNTETNYIS